MKRIALLSAAALVGLGTLASSTAQASGGGAIAAGIIGGLAAGALIGAASQAHAAPTYAPAYGYPAYGGPAYGYGPAPVVYRRAPAYRAYEVDGPIYETRRVVTYDRVPVGYGPPRDWHGGYGYRGW